MATIDRVVEVERVSNRVDEKRQDEEDVGRERIGRTPTTCGPDGRDDECCD